MEYKEAYLTIKYFLKNRRWNLLERVLGSLKRNYKEGTPDVLKLNGIRFFSQIYSIKELFLFEDSQLIIRLQPLTPKGSNVYR